MITEIDALIILTTIPHLGPVRIRLLIQYFGSALNALNTDPAIIAQFPDFGVKVSEGFKRWNQTNDWKKNRELADRYGASIIPYTSPQYPKRLLEIPDFPVLLYVKGSLIPADTQNIAVIGTRQASIYGLEMAGKLSQELAANGFTVVSGLARGIDTAAHEGALRRGRTIAVIGSGLADIYPRENSRLAEQISENGALISEFPMNTPPDKQNFPQRNRIVSGMTLGTVLVEAPLKSGASITVDRALAYNRKVFAVPGRVDQESFRGNHHLIKNGQAKLIENANDIISCFDDLFSFSANKSAERSQGIVLAPEERNFLSLLPTQELTIDEIVHLTKIPVMRINMMLMSLILKKAIKEYPGKIYIKSA